MCHAACDPLEQHKANMRAYLEKNRYNFTKENLAAMAGDSYLVPPPPLNDIQIAEQKERTKRLKNYFKLF